MYLFIYVLHSLNAKKQTYLKIKPAQNDNMIYFELLPFFHGVYNGNRKDGAGVVCANNRPRHSLIDSVGEAEGSAFSLGSRTLSQSPASACAYAEVI